MAEVGNESAWEEEIKVGVQRAISLGYQISPKAIELLLSISNKKHGFANRPSFDSILNLLLEEKSKVSLQEGIKSEVKAITEGDLTRILPELFSETTTNDSAVTKTEIEVVSAPKEGAEGQGKEGFLSLFKSRYEKILKILKERPEARQVTSISQMPHEKGISRICGLVYSKRVTKGGVELVLDDYTGKASVLAVKEEVKSDVGRIILDQCVLAEIESKNGRLLLNSITQPDLPARVTTTSKKVAYAVFLSDLHIGSNKFLEGAFGRFLDWINGRGFHSEIDDEILRHLEYIVIGGDIVDGVGVFPNQEYELIESDIVKQYEMVAEKLASIPKRYAMLAIPGNHDSTRQALPQPSIPEKYAKALYGLENLTMLGDPCVVKLRGVRTLVYHGRSLDDVLAMTPGLSYEKPVDAMKVLLKARHLAPVFGSRTPIAPELEDQLVIDTPPDIFHAGHVHSLGVESYKGTLVINSGTWQAQTSYQANLGIMPSPGIVPIVNLATFEVKLKQFLVTEG